MALTQGGRGGIDGNGLLSNNSGGSVNNGGAGGTLASPNGEPGASGGGGVFGGGGGGGGGGPAGTGGSAASIGGGGIGGNGDSNGANGGAGGLNGSNASALPTIQADGGGGTQGGSAGSGSTFEGGGGGGGAGGYGAVATANGSLTVDLSGGIGASGGGGGTDAGSFAGQGGQGGGGGGGLAFGGSALTVTSGVTVQGGVGGRGGQGGSGGNAGAAGGSGGAGGDGIDFTGLNPTTLINAGSIIGGSGAATGLSGVGFNGDPTRFFGSSSAGIGGSGVFGSNLTITNTGTIAGGLSGAGVQADAITFTSGTNVLNLGGTISGNLAIQSGTLQINAASGGSTLANTITGAGGIIQNSANTLTLSGANTYTGGTTIQLGTLNLGSTGALGTTGTLSFTGGTLQYSAANQIDYSGRFSQASDQFYSINTNGQNITYASALNSANGVLYKFGAGTLALTAANNYDGDTIVFGGILNIQNGNALGAIARGTTVSTGSTLQLQNGITVGAEALSLRGTGVGGNGALENVNGANIYGGTVTLASDARIQSDTGSLTLNAANAVTGGFNLSVGGPGDIAVAGSITTGARTLTKDGAGILTLSGANTYTGTTTINAGTLAVSGGNAISDVGAVVLSTGGTFAVNSSEAIGSLAGTGGTVALGAGQTLSTGGANATTTYAGTITGSGAFVKFGTGTLSLTGSSDYTGATTVAGGILNIQNGTALGTTASGTTVNSGATLQLQGGITIGAEGLTLSGAGVGNAGALDSVSGTNTFAGAITLGATSRINVDADSLLLTGGISGNAAGRTLTLGGAGNGEVRTNGITAVAGGLVKDGAGTWTLSADNTYASGTTISAGTLQIGNGGTTGLVTGDIANNAALIFNRSNDLSFSGVISGTGTLQKLGAGVLTLTNVDTYTGATTVAGGTLLVNGSISASATTVQSGGTLGGIGTAGAVTVASGGFLSPGNSPGLINTGNLALANGATYVEQIGGTTVGTQYDQTNVTGSVNLNSGGAASGATLSVSAVNGFTPVAGQSFVIINNDGNDAVVGTFANLAEGASVTVNGVALTISYRGGDGNDVTLSAPVPFNPPSGPTVVNDTASATFGRVLTSAAPGVLANDSGSGGTLTVTAVNGQTANVGKAVAGTYGNLALNGDGSYTYTPDATKTVFTTSVVDHFTYTDTANGQTATANLDITVSAPPASTLALFGTVVTNSASQTGSVYALYEGLLGRAPDALGLEGFSASLQAGAKLTDVAAAILNSAERGGLVSDPNAYVQALYTNTLHRAPDSAGQQFYVNELNSGVSQATVAVQFASSTEAAQVNAPAFSTGVFVTDAIDAAVARLYYGLLDRSPDATGLGGFEMQVKQAAATGGVNGAIQGLANVANVILGSQEYAATHTGQSNAAFVDSLFVGALGRHADAGGSAFYTNELAQGVSQAQVALQIAQSQEAQVHLVGQIELGWHLV